MELYEVCEKDNMLIEEIIHIEKEAFGEGAINKWFLKPLLKYQKVMVLKNKDEIIGIVEMLKKWWKSEVFIFSFVINKKYRNNGYGKIFLEKIIDLLNDYKIEKVTLTVDKENISALKLYEKFGFENIKELKNEYGIGIDRLLYELNLSKKKRV